MNLYIRMFILDFVKILFIYLGIRLILDYTANQAGFSIEEAIKGQLKGAFIFSFLFAAFRALIAWSAKRKS